MTTTYAMHELARRRDACRRLVDERTERGDLSGASDAVRDAVTLDAVLELLESEADRGKVLGFRNHATAQVLLWLENEEPLLHQADALTRETFARAEAGEDEAPRVTLGEAFRELIEAQPEIVAVCGPDADSGYAADLLGSALDAVDWLDLGGHFLAVHADHEGADA